MKVKNASRAYPTLLGVLEKQRGTILAMHPFLLLQINTLQDGRNCFAHSTTPYRNVMSPCRFYRWLSTLSFLFFSFFD